MATRACQRSIRAMSPRCRASTSPNSRPDQPGRFHGRLLNRAEGAGNVRDRCHSLRIQQPLHWTAGDGHLQDQTHLQVTEVEAEACPAQDP